MPTERELGRLYDDHAPALFAFLLTLIRNEADTRDLLQDLFIKLARQPELLTTSARNAIISFASPTTPPLIP